jgi:hypothetical protein
MRLACVQSYKRSRKPQAHGSIEDFAHAYTAPKHDDVTRLRMRYRLCLSVTAPPPTRAHHPKAFTLCGPVACSCAGRHHLELSNDSCLPPFALSTLLLSRPAFSSTRAQGVTPCMHAQMQCRSHRQRAYRHACLWGVNTSSHFYFHCVHSSQGRSNEGFWQKHSYVQASSTSLEIAQNNNDPIRLLNTAQHNNIQHGKGHDW